MNLLSLHYWFNTYPAPMQGKTLYIYSFFLFFLLILAIYSGIQKQKKGALYFKLYKKIFSFALSNFLIGSLYLFFIMETIPALSSRYWFLIWLSIMLLWLYFIFKELKRIPKEKEKREKIKEFQKYVP